MHLFQTVGFGRNSQCTTYICREYYVSDILQVARESDTHSQNAASVLGWHNRRNEALELQELSDGVREGHIESQRKRKANQKAYIDRSESVLRKLSKECIYKKGIFQQRTQIERRVLALDMQYCPHERALIPPGFLQLLVLAVDMDASGDFTGMLLAIHLIHWILIHILCNHPTIV